MNGRGLWEDACLPTHYLYHECYAFVSLAPCSFLSGITLYSFPRDALTNRQKLGGSKQQKSMISSLWRLGSPSSDARENSSWSRPAPRVSCSPGVPGL